jgi:peptidoglycan/xylan/chitin deacetylase (PgdA/CDA1 family)
MHLRRTLKRLFLLFFILAIAAGITGLWLADRYVVPIMMYHRVDYTEIPRTDTVSPENFQKHMDYLRDHGYHILRLEELIDGIKKGKVFHKKSVVLTFDDGYENNFRYAFPLLKKYQFPATIFISPDFIAEEEFLNLEQLKVMRDGGMAYGSHGMNQNYLPDLSFKELIYEVEQSKKILEKKLGVPIDCFSYPVGGFREDIKEMIQRAGYKGAVTTNRGNDRLNQDVYELNRIRFSDKDNSNVILRTKLSGYYNLFRSLKKPY